jgi:large subunit ribosomal protein L13
MIIDATDLLVGRMASFAAKQALLGEKIDIINCEKAVISGNTHEILAKYKQKQQRGIPSKGPFIHRMPDAFVKRIIRNMLPYKQDKGDKALERITCFIGIPEKFKDEKPQTVEKASSSKLPNINYTSIFNVCKELGAKI